MQRVNVEFAVVRFKAAQASSAVAAGQRVTRLVGTVHTKGVRVARPSSLVDAADRDAVELFVAGLVGAEEKGGLRKIGKAVGIGKGRGRYLKPATFDPDAPDADNDGMAQEGTTAEHPAMPGAVRSMLGRAANRAADTLDKLSERRQSRREQRKPGRVRSTLGNAAVSLADRLDGMGKPDTKPGDGGTDLPSPTPLGEIPDGIPTQMAAVGDVVDAAKGKKLAGRQYGSAFSNEKAALFEANKLSLTNPGKEFHVVKGDDGKLRVVDGERYDALGLPAVGSFHDGEKFDAPTPKQVAASADVKPSKPKQKLPGKQYGSAFKTEESAKKAALKFSKEKNGNLHVVKGEDGKFRLVNSERVEALGADPVVSFRGGQQVGGKPKEIVGVINEPNAPEVPNAPEAPNAPNAPEAPEAPNAPETPEVPGTPDAPEEPEKVEAPKTGAPDEVVASVASQLHDAWRAPRKKDDGTYEPRMKDDGKGGEVDIANTDYTDLPPKWQDENKRSAESALQAILDNPEADTEELADTVHKQWLERNGEWAPPEQKLPYAELSEEEKQKDRDVVNAAMAEAKKAGLVKGDNAPEAPDAPDAPDAPNAPEAPDAPNAPEAPEAPNAPEDYVALVDEHEAAIKAMETALEEKDSLAFGKAMRDAELARRKTFSLEDAGGVPEDVKQRHSKTVGRYHTLNVEAKNAFLVSKQKPYGEYTDKDIEREQLLNEIALAGKTPGLQQMPDLKKKYKDQLLDPEIAAAIEKATAEHDAAAIKYWKTQLSDGHSVDKEIAKLEKLIVDGADDKKVSDGLDHLTDQLLWIESLGKDYGFDEEMTAALKGFNDRIEAAKTKLGAPKDAPTVPSTNSAPKEPWSAETVNSMLNIVAYHNDVLTDYDRDEARKLLKQLEGRIDPTDTALMEEYELHRKALAERIAAEDAKKLNELDDLSLTHMEQVLDGDEEGAKKTYEQADAMLAELEERAAEFDLPKEYTEKLKAVRDVHDVISGKNDKPKNTPGLDEPTVTPDPTLPQADSKKLTDAEIISAANDALYLAQMGFPHDGEKKLDELAATLGSDTNPSVLKKIDEVADLIEETKDEFWQNVIEDGTVAKTIEDAFVKMVGNTPDLEKAEDILADAEAMLSYHEALIDGGADLEEYVATVEWLRAKLDDVKADLYTKKLDNGKVPGDTESPVGADLPDAPTNLEEWGPEQVADEIAFTEVRIDRLEKYINAGDKVKAEEIMAQIEASAFYANEFPLSDDMYPKFNEAVTRLADLKYLLGKLPDQPEADTPATPPTAAELLEAKPYVSGTFIPDGADLGIPDGALAEGIESRASAIKKAVPSSLGKSGDEANEAVVKELLQWADKAKDIGDHAVAAKYRGMAHDFSVVNGLGTYKDVELTDEQRFNLMSPAGRRHVSGVVADGYDFDIDAAVKGSTGKGKGAPTAATAPSPDALELDGASLLAKVKENGTTETFLNSNVFSMFLNDTIDDLSGRNHVMKDPATGEIHIVPADEWDKLDPERKSSFKLWFTTDDGLDTSADPQLEALKAEGGILARFKSEEEFQQFASDPEGMGTLKHVAVTVPGDDGVYLVSGVELDNALKDGKISPKTLFISGASNDYLADHFKSKGYKAKQPDGSPADPMSSVLDTKPAAATAYGVDPKNPSSVHALLGSLGSGDLSGIADHLDLTGSKELSDQARKWLDKVEKADLAELDDIIVGAEQRLGTVRSKLEDVFTGMDPSSMDDEAINKAFISTGLHRDDVMDLFTTVAIRANIARRERAARALAEQDATEWADSLRDPKTGLGGMDTTVKSFASEAEKAKTDLQVAINSLEANPELNSLQRVTALRQQVIASETLARRAEAERAKLAERLTERFSLSLFDGNPVKPGAKVVHGSTDDISEALNMVSAAGAHLKDGKTIGVFTDDKGVHHVVSGNTKDMPAPTMSFTMKAGMPTVDSPDESAKSASGKKLAPTAARYSPNWLPSKLGTLGPNGEAVAASVPDGANGIDTVDKAVAHIAAGKPMSEVPDVHLKDAVWALTEGTPESLASGVPPRFKMFDGIKKTGYNGAHSSSLKDKTWAVVDQTDGKMYVSKTADRNAQEYIQEITGNRVMQELGMPSSGIRISGDSYQTADKYGVTEEQKAILMEHGANLFDAKRVFHIDTLSAEEKADVYSRMTPESLARAAVYDRFVNYFDRTAANFLVVEDKDGRTHFHVIDHGNAFAEFKPWKWYTETGKKVSKGGGSVDESEYGFTAVGHDGVGTWTHVQAALDTDERKMAFARELLATVHRAESGNFEQIMQHSADLQGISGPQRERMLQHGRFLDGRKGNLDSYVDGALRSLGLSDEQITEARSVKAPFPNEEAFGPAPHYEGAASFTDAITRAHGLGVPGHVYTPLTVAGGDDGQMAVTAHAVGSLGSGMQGPITETRFRLTSDAADELIDHMTQDGDWIFARRHLFPQKVGGEMRVPYTPGDHTSSLLTSGGSMESLGWVDRVNPEDGVPFTAIKQVDADTVVYFYGYRDESSFVGANTVRIFRNGAEVTPDQLNGVLGELGLGDARYATAEDTARRALKLFTQSFAAHKEGLTTDEKVEYIKKFRGVSPSDVEVYYDSLGRMRLRLTEEGYANYVAETNLKKNAGGVYKAVSTPELVVNMVRGGSVQSAADRYFSGEHALKNSAASDMGTGGGAYNFVHGIDTHGSSGADFYQKDYHLVFDEDAMFRELRFMARTHDSFGAVNPKNGHFPGGFPDTAEVIKNGKFYDGMFPGSIPMEFVSEIRVRDLYARNSLLDKFAAAGIDEVNGIPVKDFVQLQLSSTSSGIPPIGNSLHPKPLDLPPGIPLEGV